ARRLGESVKTDQATFGNLSAQTSVNGMVPPCSCRISDRLTEALNERSAPMAEKLTSVTTTTAPAAPRRSLCPSLTSAQSPSNARVRSLLAMISEREVCVGDGTADGGAFQGE